MDNKLARRVIFDQKIWYNFFSCRNRMRSSLELIVIYAHIGKKVIYFRLNCQLEFFSMRKVGKNSHFSSDVNQNETACTFSSPQRKRSSSWAIVVADIIGMHKWFTALLKSQTWRQQFDFILIAHGRNRKTICQNSACIQA